MIIIYNFTINEINSKLNYKISYIIDSSTYIFYRKNKFYSFVFSIDSEDVSGFINIDINKNVINYIDSLSAFRNKKAIKIQTINFRTNKKQNIKYFGHFGSDLYIERKNKSKIVVVHKNILPTHSLYIVSFNFLNYNYPTFLEIKMKGATESYFAFPELLSSQ